MGKILSFSKKKKSVKKSSSYLDYMKAIIASHREGKVLQFPMSKVIIERMVKSFKERERIDYICETCNLYEDLEITEAEYQGKKVKLNDPIRTSENPNKKFKVYVKDGDSVKVVRFGDPNLSIKRDDPGRRKNFRARHNCDNPGPKTKARYWSCFQWRAGAKVDN